MSAVKGRTVGIDLGTTFSALAYLDEQGKPVIVPNQDGELITPSVILFDKESVVVGREAKRSAVIEPDNVVDVVKRYMGKDSYPKKIGATGQRYKPEVLSAMILKKLKQDAEKRIGAIDNAVITVPAYFDDTRRKATQDAGQIAGLNVIDIVNEPTAAALAYGLNQLGQDQTVLVYDLGGGTFDVTVLRISGNNIRALATDGDVQLGGKDWDGRVIDYVAEQFLREAGADPRDDPYAFQELTKDAEDAKKTLTTRESAKILCNYANHRASVELTRDNFESLTIDLLERTQLTTELIIEDAHLAWNDIDKVILVGGSTRMPMVKRMLKEVTGKDPDDSMEADLAVANGAAIHAAIRDIHAGAKQHYSTDVVVELEKVKQVNVNSHSLGIIVRDRTNPDVKRNKIMIRRNSQIPCSVDDIFGTAVPNQTRANIIVTQGESDDPNAVTQLGVCQVELPLGLPKGSKIKVSYAYKDDGRITVTGVDLTSGNQAQVTLNRSSGMTDIDVKQEVARMQTVLVE